MDRFDLNRTDADIGTTALATTLPFEPEAFEYSTARAHCIRVPAGQEKAIPCSKYEHDAATTTVLFGGQEIKIEQSQDEVPHQTIFLLDGNKVAIPRIYEQGESTPTYNLRYAFYVKGVDPIGFDGHPVALPVKDTSTEQLCLSVRDAKVLGAFLEDKGLKFAPLYEDEQGQAQVKPVNQPLGQERRPLTPFQRKFLVDIHTL